MAINDLTEDEVHLLTCFRNADRLERARIMLATCREEKERSPEETQKLEFFAAYMDCNKYGRARCLETAEIFAGAATIEEAHARLAELEDARARCIVVDIADFRP